MAPLARRRRVMLAVAAGVAAVAVLVAVLVVIGRHGSGRHKTAAEDVSLDAAAGARAAAAGCAQIAQMRRDIERNASSAEVLRDVDAAVASARTAQLRDPKWVPLYSAALEVSHALHTDNAAEATQALQIVDQSCPHAAQSGS